MVTRNNHEQKTKTLNEQKKKKQVKKNLKISMTVSKHFQMLQAVILWLRLKICKNKASDSKQEIRREMEEFIEKERKKLIKCLEENTAEIKDKKTMKNDKDIGQSRRRKDKVLKET